MLKAAYRTDSVYFSLPSAFRFILMPYDDPMTLCAAQPDRNENCSVHIQCVQEAAVINRTALNWFALTVSALHRTLFCVYCLIICLAI
jgi:hypothetical protein